MRRLTIDDPRWLDFVGAQARATLFHHPAWAGLLAETYGYRALAVGLDGGGGLAAGLPFIDVSLPLGRRRWVSLPFTDHCPPLDGDRPLELAGALAELARASGLAALEVRGPLGGPGGAGYVRHALPVSADAEGTFARLARNHRRNVRIAGKAGVRVSSSRSAADLDVFYRLHLRTRRRLGVPVQPRRFFRLLLERIIEPGLGFILVAHSGDIPVAAAIFGSWNGTLLYKYSARDERYAKLDASYLLLWTAIQWACENGYHTVDLGRSDLDQVPLREFKDGWGATEEPLAYSWIADQPVRASTGRAHDVMGVVIRNSAPWLCQAVGEVFYRYAT
jgi:CelD/BcsL family acetyltransferase involved in cellulose biosynthesis